MILVTSNPARQFLCLRYLGAVTPAELSRGREDVLALLPALQPGFSVLVDLTELDSMGVDCVPELGSTMEAMDSVGVGTVVRVIPDPAKDVGLNILSVFHYSHRPRSMTCRTLLEGVRVLAI